MAAAAAGAAAAAPDAAPPLPPPPSKQDFLRVVDVATVGGARTTVALHVTYRPASDSFDLQLIDGVNVYRAEGG